MTNNITRNIFKDLLDGQIVEIEKEVYIRLDEYVTYNELIACIKDTQDAALLNALKSQVI